ncbi:MULTISPECIES: hypothetical protein [unclassified Mesorhizobium]|uniref:hypothetical protein n=1 Tax=unclassified Mesorhizobium TaxID=325217 RepID=UPI001127D464|nr:MULTISPECIES: hypothetical protein [unclassified Mesorhizobium]MCA0027375.1 hypothetical protein [Mesorhizobium sp. B263B1A]TPJ98648.1 hypothetical protein FJ489_06890 [Mesorhizobium sp. B2-5-12]TPK28811.1 hypothetical protein FJ562_00280 [Mesorhizobium sp. B2-5-6]
MSELASLHNARARPVDGEPLRILIGHVLHRAVEIVPAAGFMADLRAAFLCDIDEGIASFDQPAEGGKGDGPAANSEAATSEGQD